jgi:hypothetical protein
LNTLANLIRRNPARAAEARQILDRAIALQEQLVAMAVSVPDYLSKLATMCDSLANLLRSQKEFDAAETLYRRELSYQSRLTAEHPQVVAYRYGHGQALHNLADLLRERRRPAEGLPLERKAVQELERLYRSNVRNPEFRLALSYAYWTLCAILLDGKDHRAASAAVAEYLRIEPNGYEESFESTEFLCRCAELCRSDQSIAAPEREALTRTYSDRAMDALRTAVRNGFQDLNHLKTSPSYEPIRPREDFRRLVREVEATTEDAGPLP